MMPNNDVGSPLNVLVICPRALDFINLKRIPNSDQYQFNFLDAPIELSGFSEPFDLLAYLDRCREYIHKHSIDIIIPTQDVPALIQAQLYNEFENLYGSSKAPSLESSLLCLHKYYTRKYIDPAPIPFDALDLNDEKKITAIDIPFPWVMKPCTTACSSQVYKVANLDEAISLLPTLKENIIHGNKYLMPFFNTYFDDNRYPLIHKNLVLIEQYVPSMTRCCVDGCVYDGEIIIWGISEANSYPGLPESTANAVFPSLLPQHIQAKLKTQYIHIVSQLIDYGFNRQFVNVEFFIQEDGSIKLLEVNGRISPLTATIYRRCLIDGDPYDALLTMYQNRCPQNPNWNKLYGVFFYVTVFAEGQADELIDFEAAKSFPEVALRVKPSQFIHYNKDIGVQVASFSLVGEHYQDMCSQAESIRQSLLIN